MSVFFSRFMGNESQCGTNKSRELLRGSRDLFVPHCDSFPMNREKKDTHSLYLQCLQQRPPYENEKWAAHELTTEAVGSSVDRSCPLFMWTHYNICPWAAHGQLSGQELPNNVQSHYNIWPWAAHGQLRLLDYIVGRSVGSSNFIAEVVVGSGQLQHMLIFIMPVNNNHTVVANASLGRNIYLENHTPKHYHNERPAIVL